MVSFEAIYVTIRGTHEAIKRANTQIIVQYSRVVHVFNKILVLNLKMISFSDVNVFYYIPFNITINTITMKSCLDQRAMHILL